MVQRLDVEKITEKLYLNDQVELHISHDYVLSKKTFETILIFLSCELTVRFLYPRLKGIKKFEPIANVLEELRAIEIFIGGSELRTILQRMRIIYRYYQLKPGRRQEEMKMKVIESSDERFLWLKILLDQGVVVEDLLLTTAKKKQKVSS